MTEVTEANPSTIFTVAVSKGRAGNLDVDSAKAAEYCYIDALKKGFKVQVNSGMTTIKKENYKTEGEFKAAVMAKANENLQAIYKGTLVIRGSSKAKGDKVPTEVLTLARNMARAIVKAEAKKKGFKISLIKPAVITKHANALLLARPELVAKAQEEVNRQQEEAAEAGGIGLEGLEEDPGLIQKATEAKSAKQLSAAKAGKVAGRGRPGLNA